MREPVVAYVGLGANLGDAQMALDGAVRSLRLAPGVTVTAQSSQYQSAPIDSSGPDYINSVVEVRTELTAPALLACLHAIENAAGRERPFQNAPRTLDLDLLLFGDASISSPVLTVPHPRMGLRAFVLLPLAEIAPHRVDAAQREGISGQAIQRLTSDTISRSTLTSQAMLP